MSNGSAPRPREHAPTIAELGGRDHRAFVSESDPTEVCPLSEWNSHDAMMAATDRFGE